MLPKFVKRLIRDYQKRIGIYTNFLRDAKLFNKYSRGQRLGKDTVDALLFINAHSIEKGLSLGNRKTDFGEIKALNLAKLLLRRGDEASETAKSKALGTLRSYLDFREPVLQATSDFRDIQNLYNTMAEKNTGPIKGGVKEHTGPLASENLRNTFEEFLKTRKSVRHFSPRFSEDDHDRVKNAATLASLAPSQCNRQSSKIHIYRNTRQIQKLLGIQAGTRGFSEEIPCLAAITNQLNYWKGSAQRNQAWVDGGIFGMTFLLALHSQNFATCTLNMAKTFEDEKKFKAIAHIPESERLLFLIAVGNFPAKYRTAISARIPVEKYCTIHA